MKRLFTLISWAAGLLLLASAHGGQIDPRSWALPAILCLALPVISLLVGGWLVVCLIARKWRAAGVVALCIALSWPALRLSAPFKGERAVEDADMSFSVMTYNVKGFEGDGETMRYILRQNADFVLLQEGALGPHDFTDLPQIQPMKAEIEQKYPYHSHGYHDLIILSKRPYTVYQDTTLKHGFGSPDDINSEYHFYAKAFDVDIQGTPLRIINLHLQSIGLSSDDKQLYRRLTGNRLQGRADVSQVKHSLMSKLKRAFQRRANEAQLVRAVLDDPSTPANVIVCGDFNDTPGSFSYRTICGHDMHDAFAECGWWPANTYNSDRFYFKIDHILYRGNMQATSIARHRAGDSDHYPQIATFALRMHD